MGASDDNHQLETIAEGLIHHEEQAYVDFMKYFLPKFRVRFRNLGSSEMEAEDWAEDIAVDIALEKADKYKRYEEKKGNFKAWVFTLARHAWIDRKRKQLPQNLFDENGETGLENDLAETEESYSELPGAVSPSRSLTPGVFQTELDEPADDLPDIGQAVREAIEQLPENHRLIINLHYADENLSLAEIARSLGIPAGRVRMWHLRAKEKLEKVLSKDPRIGRRLARVHNVKEETE
jgi:RNA polymerase sigma factor (sigma-70 family)